MKSQSHSLTLVQDHSDSTFSNFFFLETAWRLKPNFMYSLHGMGGRKFDHSCLDHLTKTVAMPIYGKNLKKTFFSGTKRSMTLKAGMLHWVLKYYQVNSKDDPGMTLTYFTVRSNLVPYAFVWRKR